MFITYSIYIYIHSTDSTDYRVGRGYQHISHCVHLSALLNRHRRPSYMSAISAGRWGGRWNFDVAVLQRCSLSLSCFSETDILYHRLLWSASTLSHRSALAVCRLCHLHPTTSGL